MKKCALTLLFLILTTPLHADVVYYKDGTKSEGKIIKVTKNIVIIREIVNGVQCVTEAPQSLVERIERGPVLRSRPLPKEAIKKESVVIPKEVPVSVVQLSASGIDEELEQKNASVKEGWVAREVREKEQERLAKQERIGQEAQQKKIAQEQAANEKTLRQENKKELMSIQKTESEQKSPKLCRYLLGNREDKNLDFGNKVTMRRIEVSVVVPNDASFTQLKNLFSYFLQKELRENKKLDAFWVIAYREAYSKKGIPIAYGIWAPPGGWDDFSHTQNKDQYQWQYRLIKR